MSTTLWMNFGFAVTDTTRGTNTAKANGSTSGWDTTLLDPTQTTGGPIAVQTDTVAGPTSGVEICDSDPARPQEYISPPLAANVTISGTITFNVWAMESNMSANVGMQVIVERLDSQLNIVSTVVNSEKAVEVTVSTTTPAVNNWTATPTSTSFLKGDRIRARVLGNDIGTMATGFLFSAHVLPASGGTSGDTWISFTETLTFLTSSPTGSTLYLTDTAAGINPGAATELEAWTSRGSGSTNSITNSTTGWTAPIQLTNTGGGTALEWYSKPLQAFTLGGVAEFNIRAKKSSNPSFIALRGELAVCAQDGTSPTVWGASGLYHFNEIDPLNDLTESPYTVRVSGADTSVSDGQRLRLRVFIDDSALFAMITGIAATITYSGTTAGAAGDSYVVLPQTVAEFTGGGGAAAPPAVTQPHVLALQPDFGALASFA